MLGVSGSESAGTRENRESGAVSGGSSEVAINFTEEDKRNMEELGERNSGGNRWPRQETIALLKIRSEMDVVFRDSSLKGPLWEEVSRKMAELGYYRNAKKCKEKFENVYKYHKRTKDGRASKSDGKNYRFFEQLAALENNPPHPCLMLAAAPSASTSRPPPPPLEATPINMAMPNNVHHQVPTDYTAAAPVMNNIPASSVPVPPQVISGNVSYSTSSSTSSDEDIERRHKKKRKWKDFFERLMKEVIEKQEELQRNFLESLEKREGERIAREEAWRVEQVTRMNREHDVLVKERSMAAAKDAAVISFLQKITEQQNINTPPHSSTPSQQQQPQLSLPLTIQPELPIPQTQTQVSLPLTIQPQLPQVVQPELAAKKVETLKSHDHSGDTQASSSRWPKTEVEALIRLRTNLDVKYLENGPKGPLWEEISAGMKKLGYNRNSKRCKEKWENINKYFKKVKESNKRRPQDSKTCPYFHQLDALYREKANTTQTPLLSTTAMPPIMARPLHQQHPMDETELSDDDEDEENAYEVVTNKQQSSTPPATTTL